MGISGSADIFQAEMMDLMEAPEYVRAYIDDLLCITRWTLEDHLDKLEEVLKRLRDAGLKVNTTKSFFYTHKIEYLGYMQTRGGIKPQIKSTGNTHDQATQQCQGVKALPRNGTILPQHVGKA
jgi:hypothetical protein